MTDQEEFFFIYNADSALGNTIVDGMHKILSPATYQCELCSLSYGALSMKKSWRDFLNQLPGKKTFLYKDQLPLEAPFNDIKLPAVLLKRAGKAEIIISYKDFKSLDLEQLMERVKIHLSNS